MAGLAGECVQDCDGSGGRGRCARTGYRLGLLPYSRHAERLVRERKGPEGGKRGKVGSGKVGRKIAESNRTVMRGEGRRVRMQIMLGR